MMELKELDRVLRDLERAPAELRQAAALRLAAWTRKHAPMAAEVTSSLFMRRAAVLFLFFAVPLALLSRAVSSAACSSRSAPPLVREAHTLRQMGTAPCGGSRLPRNSGRINAGRGAGASTNGCKRQYPEHEAFMHPRDGLSMLRPHRNTSEFPLIVAVGHGKTATKSLNKVPAPCAHAA